MFKIYFHFVNEGYLIQAENIAHYTVLIGNYSFDLEVYIVNFQTVIGL